jgi:hypothetical protein
MSVSQRRNSGLSLNCLYSSASSLSTARHHAFERLVVLDPGVLLIRVLLGVLISFIGRDLCWNLFSHKLSDAVIILQMASHEADFQFTRARNPKGKERPKLDVAA